MVWFLSDLLVHPRACERRASSFSSGHTADLATNHAGGGRKTGIFFLNVCLPCAPQTFKLFPPFHGTIPANTDRENVYWSHFRPKEWNQKTKFSSLYNMYKMILNIMEGCWWSEIFFKKWFHCCPLWAKFCSADSSVKTLHQRNLLSGT